MKSILKTITVLCMLLNFISCESPNPNINNKGKDELKSLEVDYKINTEGLEYIDIIYVPIYSDIYVNRQDQKSLLTATLSIRNTSYVDSLFVSKIDYFNTQGRLVRHYIDKPISLSPMATINYVIEKEDEEGGAGANFIVELKASNKNIQPIIQAIMIGENGSNQGFAFLTDGYSIKK